VSLTVLVTRTKPQGASLCRRLAASGWRVLYGPPIRLEGPSDPLATATRLSKLLPADRIILTSSRAVEETLRLVSPDVLNAASLIVPGAGTARMARRFGLTSIHYPEQGGSSEALLELPLLQRPSALRVLILAARGGRRYLGEELQRRGARVERLHVYRRVEQALPFDVLQTLQATETVISLISSGGALNGLLHQLPEDLWRRLCRWPVIVPSRRVAKLAESLGCRLVIEASGADDDAMIESLSLPAVRAGLR